MEIINTIFFLLINQGFRSYPQIRNYPQFQNFDGKNFSEIRNFSFKKMKIEEIKNTGG